MSTDDYDLIVIGSGAAAGPVVRETRRAGWRVAVVDHGSLGGTCAQTGCVPKRVWANAAEVVDSARRLRGRGVDGEVAVAWPALQRFTESFTGDVPENTWESFEGEGVDVIQGHARFAGETQIEVDGRKLGARYIHLATGARPRHLGIPGEELITTTDDLLSGTELPGRVVFVGGGYVSFELGMVLAIAGAEVTILDENTRALEDLDLDLASLLIERVQLLGIDVRHNAEVKAVERAPDGGLRARTGAAGEIEWDADAVVHGAGRVPAIEGLHPARGGVDVDDDGVKVNNHMRSCSNSRVYAAGDVVSGSLAQTPVAAREAEIAAANLVAGDHRVRSTAPIPRLLFSVPPLGRVGLLEEEARRNQLDVRVRRGRTDEWLSSRMRGLSPTAYKLVIDARTDQLLGAHVLGPDAEQQVNLFALAMQLDIPAAELRGSVLAFPTGGSDLRSMVG